MSSRTLGSPIILRLYGIEVKNKNDFLVGMFFFVVYYRILLFYFWFFQF